MTGPRDPVRSSADEPEREERARESPRAHRMAERIRRRAVEVGVSADGLRLLARAYSTAMSVRESHADGLPGLPSDRHHAFLHPGRTVLILLDDLDETVGSTLAVGAMAESRDAELRVRAVVAARVLATEADAYQIWASLPRPDWQSRSPPTSAPSDTDLLELLVTAPSSTQRIALAEALDHLRHAHLWSSRAERARAVELARDVYGPLAPRVHPTLQRRLDWWLRRVAPGLLG